jgi:bla regulator protein blaR1
LPLQTRNFPALLAVLSFVLVPQISAQLKAPPSAVREFEVASIKPSRPGAVGSLMRLRSPQGGRTSARNVPVRDLILLAYHIQAFQLSGGPAWLNTERYDLDATYQPTASLVDIRAMLQKFLVDRCNLTVRRGTKDGPLYNLVVAKSGPKLKPPKPDGFDGIRSSENGGMLAESATMSSLAEALEEQVKRPVLDKTGLSGTYAFSLEATAEEEGGADREPIDSTSPSIFTAIQEHLGLKMESARGPVQNISIQRIERPSQN